MTSQIVTHEPGDSPLVLSMPHVGTDIPPDIAGRLNELGRAVPDTDWWIDRLYDFAAEFRPSIVRAQLSRYVIDVNRDPARHSLYPGQATTGLCPATTFDGAPIYRPGEEPDDAEISRRHDLYFRPYHTALRKAIDSTRARHNYCLLYDCHSIRSVVPRLFDGTLPVLNVGTNRGASCAPEIGDAIAAACAGSGFDHVINGRFTGGWITRNYGDPGAGVHAVQMELAQRGYVRETPPWEFLEEEANRLRPALRRVLKALLTAGAALTEAPRPD